MEWGGGGGLRLEWRGELREIVWWRICIECFGQVLRWRGGTHLPGVCSRHSLWKATMVRMRGSSSKMVLRTSSRSLSRARVSSSLRSTPRVDSKPCPATSSTLWLALLRVCVCARPSIST